MTTTLVLGRTTLGKQRHVVSLFDGAGDVTVVTTPQVDSVRTGPVHLHLPETWSTVKADDVTRAILRQRTPVLLDDVRGWVASLIEAAGAWDDPDAALARVDLAAAELAALWANLPYDSVAVSDDTGDAPDSWLLDEAHSRALEALGSASARTHVVIAGRVLDLTSAPVVR